MMPTLGTQYGQPAKCMSKPFVHPLQDLGAHYNPYTHPLCWQLITVFTVSSHFMFIFITGTIRDSQHRPGTKHTVTAPRTDRSPWFIVVTQQRGRNGRTHVDRKLARAVAIHLNRNHVHTKQLLPAFNTYILPPYY